MLFMTCVCQHLSRLSIAALWSTAGKGLTSWLLFVMFNCDFVTFLCGILGQMWYLILSIPDLCCLSYFGGNTSRSRFVFTKPLCLVASIS